MSAPLNLGALVAPYQPNALQQLSQAFANFPQQQQQAEMDKLAVQDAKQQLDAGKQQTELNDFQLQAQKQQLAQQQWTQLGGVIKSNDRYKMDPSVISKVQELAGQLGLPAPIDENGHVDVSAWQTPWDSLDPTMQQKINDDAIQRPAGSARDAFYASYSGVPAALRTAPQSFSAKDDAALARAKAYGLHVNDEGKYLGERGAFLKAQAAVVSGMADAKEQSLYAQAQKYTADAKAASINAQARLMQAQAALQRAGAEWARVRMGGSYGTAVARQQKGKLDAQRRVLTDQLSTIKTALLNQSKVSQDPENDPTLAKLQQQEQALQTSITAIDQQYSDYVNYLGTNQGDVTTLQAQSGKTVQSVTTVGGGQPKTKVNPANGKTYYLWSDGNYHSAPQG